jgi:hypothetical protein
MASKSVVNEVKEITLAIELIELGARLQLLEAETSLSRDRLIKLYKELKGVSPPKDAAVLDRLVHDVAAEHPFVAVLQHLPVHAGRAVATRSSRSSRRTGSIRSTSICRATRPR